MRRGGACSVAVAAAVALACSGNDGGTSPTPLPAASSGRGGTNDVTAGAPAVAGNSAGGTVGVGGSGGAPSTATTSAGTTSQSGPGGGGAGSSATAGSGGSAGIVGAGGTGAVAASGALVFGPSQCAGSGFLLCEDFEGASIDSQRWQVENGAPHIGSAHAARGTHALELSFKAGQASQVLKLSKLPEQLKQHLFGRLYVWSQEETPIFRNPGDNYDTFQHVEFFRAKSPAQNDYMGFSTGVVGAMRLTSPNDHAVDAGHFSAGKWMCVEWEFDPKQKFARGWLNDGGVESSGKTNLGDPNWALPAGDSFDSAYLGLVVITRTTPDMHVWIDELALGTERIGCNR